MLVKLLFLSIYLISEVRSNDIRLGFVAPSSRKIYGEIKEADPALWKRTDDIIINTPHNEVITAVLVTDLRDDKDGEAFIESGGVGLKSVTIGLKSPSILRGYKFEIEVYGSDTNERLYSKGGFAPYSGDVQYARKF
ncbi:unnamed protein product [Leptosia nina]|uniref:Uncharacterized protein n=1 Tax=Leptosia nina TaxID=320188 RepID=A0AAV1JEM0_9NEOP